MTSLANSDVVKVDGYTLTIKRRKLDHIFDKITIKRRHNEKNLRKTRDRASSKDIIVKKMKRKIKRRALKIMDIETKLNAATGGQPIITVENYVDFDIPFMNFIYESDYVLSNDVKISSKRHSGCDCGTGSTNTCFDSRSNCCAVQHNYQFAYDRTGKVILPQGVPIFECSSKCSCGPNCGNRVVQQGSKGHQFCIFKTENGCGWGVKTLKHIPEGVFVELVAGEVITSSEAARREKLQLSKLKQSYLFDLDFVNQQRPRYSIDSFALGNITRYINHSCEPNLGVYNVWVHHRDPQLPKLALFAVRDIQKDEELTLDYKPQIGQRDPHKRRSQTNGANQISCLCGAANCRQFLWSN